MQIYAISIDYECIGSNGKPRPADCTDLYANDSSSNTPLLTCITLHKMDDVDISWYAAFLQCRRINSTLLEVDTKVKEMIIEQGSFVGDNLDADVIFWIGGIKQRIHWLNGDYIPINIYMSICHPFYLYSFPYLSQHVCNILYVMLFLFGGVPSSQPGT